jgi:hypothetical protein
LLADAYAVFSKLLKQENLEPVKRASFKAMVVSMIKDQFEVCLRNDLQVDERAGVRGWKRFAIGSAVSPRRPAPLRLEQEQEI